MKTNYSVLKEGAMKRDIRVFLIILVLTAMAMTGCTSGSRYQKSVFNDDDKIINGEDSYTYKKRIGNMVKDKIDMKFGIFTGIETVNKIKAEKDGELLFTFQSKINEGDFKVVLITPDDEIINILEGTSEGTKTIPIKKGVNRIRLVGREAKGKVKIEID